MHFRDLHPATLRPAAPLRPAGPHPPRPLRPEVGRATSGGGGGYSPPVMPKIAVVQRPPLLLDRAGSFRLAADAIAEAAAAGAKLVVFPESFIGGYPDWAW